MFQKPAGGWYGTLNEDAQAARERRGAAYDEFGRCVSICNNKVVVGAEADDDLGSASGSAYVFVLWTLGDMNCDSAVDNFDIEGFTLALVSVWHEPPFDDYLAAYPGCCGMLADINGDGSVNKLRHRPVRVTAGALAGREERRTS